MTVPHLQLDLQCGSRGKANVGYLCNSEVYLLLLVTSETPTHLYS